MERISSYFKKHIEALKWDDEDEFVKVLDKTLNWAAGGREGGNRRAGAEEEEEGMLRRQGSKGSARCARAWREERPPRAADGRQKENRAVMLHAVGQRDVGPLGYGSAAGCMPDRSVHYRGLMHVGQAC